MARNAEQVVRHAVSRRTFDSAYYLIGEDDFRKEEAARELAAAALEESLRDFNYEALRGGEVSREQLDTAINTPALFGGKRVVLVRDVHALRKDVRDLLLAFLENPSPGTLLLLVAPAGEKPDKGIAERATVLDFRSLEGEQLSVWITDYARKRLGVEIEPEAVRLLQEAVGPELAHLTVELDKLASYTGGERIDATAVSAVVGIVPGVSLGALLDAVAERDAARGPRLVGPVLASGRTSAVSVIMALATQFLALSWGAALRTRRQPQGVLERGYYALLREGKAYPGRPWSEAVSLWVRVLPRWSVAETERALRLLLAADIAAKDARLSSEEQLLSSVVLSLCQSERKAA